MPKRSRRGSRGLRPGTLAKMSNKQLARAGYIRIAGFTKKDGSKVKSHIRKLNLGEQSVRAMDTLSDGLVGGAKYLSDAVVGNLGKALKGDKESIGKIVDFVPVIGDVKAGKESADAFGKGDILTGSLLGVAGVVGIVPFVGDFAAKGLKPVAKGLKKLKNVDMVKTLKGADPTAKAFKVAKTQVERPQSTSLRMHFNSTEQVKASIIHHL